MNAAVWLHERQSRGGPVPHRHGDRAVERDHTVRARAGAAARFVQEHQREQAEDLGIGHQLREQAVRELARRGQLAGDPRVADLRLGRTRRDSVR